VDYACDEALSFLEKPICSLLGVPSRRPLTIFPRAAKNVQARFGEKGEKLDILADLVYLQNEKPECKVTYVFGIALTNFGAGHDTITASFTAILTCICQDESHVARVREEIATVGENHRYHVVTKLRFLQACMKEAMRLFPVVGQSMPRVVPTDLTLMEMRCLLVPLLASILIFRIPRNRRLERMLVPLGLSGGLTRMRRRSDIWRGIWCSGRCLENISWPASCDAHHDEGAGCVVDKVRYSAFHG
jgi:hypothetical protein